MRCLSFLILTASAFDALPPVAAALPPRFGGRYAYRFDRVAAGTAFGVQEPKQVLKRFGVRRIPEPLFVLLDRDQPLHPEFFEVMREGRVRYAELGLKITDDHPFGVGGKQ